MRKEIIGILLFFLVVFTLISLMSYSPEDPSFHHGGGNGGVENFFGLFGAHLAGLLIGLFGVGAFWFPVLFFITSVEFFRNQPGEKVVLNTIGGVVLVVATGSLFALYQDAYFILGRMYSAGGMVGYPVKVFLMKYSNWTGATVILILFLFIGFILSTDVSVVETGKKAIRLTAWTGRRICYLSMRSFQALKKVFEILQAVKASWVKRRIEKEPAAKAPKPKKPLPTQPPSVPALEVKEEPAEERPITIRQTLPPRPLRTVPMPKQQEFESMKPKEGFQLPPVGFLKDPEVVIDSVDHENLRQMSKLLEQKLDDFGVKGKVVTVLPGPVVTRFEFEPAPGIKINKVVNLSDDLALALRAMSIRIIAPIPGKAVIGIEVPNAKREIVVIKDVIVSAAFEKSKSKLTLAMGKDIVGNPIVADLETMPHLLIAGATGTGKSVALNTMITSMLFKTTPEEVKMIMIDPKRIELSMYDGIPHLITPVVTEMKKATNALFWAVREMERRYKLLSEARVRNIRQYNRKVKKADSEEDIAVDAPQETLPYIVIIIDELADLMMVASRDVEVSLTRLAQMARAAGIHLILATQRPSVDILTGVIKANFPTRLSFQVSSKIDSRTIIDANGAETLLGNGDMLFLPPGTAKLQRIHGAFISEEELSRVIEFLKAQKPPEYDHAILQIPEPEEGENGDKDYDDRYDEAVALVTKTGQASISMIQRHLRIGYNRAARIVEMMETEGVVGPSDGV
ncbi:MAG: DNA translocase FtsK 4TM domain-containing protein, partial [Desulfobacterales bacterium]|nr:DNA translocase FtsK 4TM domain-containing protein [Desulfobacterales bacterium]